MSKPMQWTMFVPAALLSLGICGDPRAQQAEAETMTFFITSTGSGNGADLGGLDGADRHCRQLADAAGAGDRGWRAYLSTQGDGAVTARDRIGGGPWHNAKGEPIAESVEDLHGPNNRIGKETALTERGEMVKGRGDDPNMHDILTGSQPDGRAFPDDEDRTCRNWTSSAEGAAMVGHHDRRGLREDEASRSWNASHPTRGCSQEALRGTGGDGLFYCFAAD